MSRTVTLSPFNRVEGDLRVEIVIDDGVLVDARASGVMYRGFEKILSGCNPEQALVLTPRICGMCSISHSVASSLALRAVSEELTPAASGVDAANICHAVENAMNHISQFYLYFAPDLLNKKYKGLALYQDLAERLTPGRGTSFTGILKERKRFLEIIGLIAGKWPHTLAIQPGGTTRALNSSDIFRIKGVLAGFSSVVGSVLLGMPVDEYLSIRSVAELEQAISGGSKADLGLFYGFAAEAGLTTLGKGPGRFISAGAYPGRDGAASLRPGFHDKELSDIDVDGITESVRYSFFDAPAPFSRPADDQCEPKPDKTGAYSWCKAPRYRGAVVEVGPLGRQLIDGDPLVTELFSKLGSTAFTRMFARLHEAVGLLSQIAAWTDRIEPDTNYYAKHVLKKDGSGAGLTEAARGFLGHWIVVENGKIKNYQVITPTTWNASPRDEKGTPGAMEQALIGTRLEDDRNPVEIDHIIRSFDPCLVCSVH